MSLTLFKYLLRVIRRTKDLLIMRDMKLKGKFNRDMNKSRSIGIYWKQRLPVDRYRKLGIEAMIAKGNDT
ncbi:CLUMA_CG002946, isoform A [Clunio marinus]|uniref:CLUMA_CG002946, isoform A n=1 Tax=Clunio marinus TaxID=568069 RepID=A0A1J1HSL4_9DIPT|nr:CLUMA_CG002946, isoform A [Clunio marinus]